MREWVRGGYWMPRHGSSDRAYFTEVPDEEWQPPAPLSDEERERRRAARMAQLREWEKTGIVKITVVHEED